MKAQMTQGFVGLISRPKLTGAGRHAGVLLPDGGVAHMKAESAAIVAFDEFEFAPMAPFWTAAAILLLGALLSLVWWGPTRVREMAAGRLANGGDSEPAAPKAA